MTADILRKTADDAAQGMWCQGAWFGSDKVKGVEGEALLPAILNSPEHLVDRVITLEEMMASPRCIEGSIAIATRMLGGDFDDFLDAVDVLSAVVSEECDSPEYCETVVLHNDRHMSADSPTYAGLQWSELARKAADRAAGF